MFEDMDRLVERLLDAAPTDDELADPERPLPQRMRALVDELVLQQRITAASEGRSMVIMAELCKWAEQWQQIHDPTMRDELGPDDLVAAEIAPALHLAPVTAAIRVHTALDLHTRLAATLAAMCRGELDKARVLAIREAVADLDDDLAEKVEGKVLPGAPDQTAGELRRALTKAVIAADPGAAERRRKAAVRDRSVTSWTRRDGTGAIEAVLSAVDSGEIYDLIDEIARRTKTTHDTRSMDARRADAFVQLLLGRDPHLGPQDEPPPGPLPPDRDNWPLDPHDAATHAEPHWQPPADTQTTADATADAGADVGAGEASPVEPDDLDERFPPEPADPEPASPTRSERISELAALTLSAMTTRRPPRLPWVAINQTTTADGNVCFVGELQGHGPITAESAAHLLTTGAARAPDQPSDRTPTPTQARTHDPPGWLDREVRARDTTCRFPGCKQPAHRIDLDHVIPFPRGLTLRTNLGGLCRRHHRLKTTGYWHVQQHTNGTYEWTSTLTSRTYTTYPRGTTGDWRGATDHQSARPHRADD